MSAKRTPAQAYLAKVRRRPAKNEHCLQRAIVTWCRGIGAGYVKDRFAAIPNGGSRGHDARSRAIAGRKMKDEGVRPGMPDLEFWRDGGRVLWLEVKLGTSGTVSESQKEVHASLRSNGFPVYVVRTLAEACQKIVEFYTK